MPLLEETSLPQEPPPTIPVVIIGNFYIQGLKHKHCILKASICQNKFIVIVSDCDLANVGVCSFLQGNGPSGICLSYLLSGYKPYLDSAAVHPNSILYRKLQETKHLPITEQVTTPPKKSIWFGFINCNYVSSFRIWSICAKAWRAGQETLSRSFLTHCCTQMLTLATSSPLSFSGEGTRSNISHMWFLGRQHPGVHGM